MRVAFSVTLLPLAVVAPLYASHAARDEIQAPRGDEVQSPVSADEPQAP